MLTPAQKTLIVQTITQQINKPILNTALGKFALNALVDQVDNVLSKNLPPDIAAILDSAADGLTPVEVQHLEQVLPGYLTQNIHSLLLQGILNQVITIVVSVLITALQQGHTVASATATPAPTGGN